MWEVIQRSGVSAASAPTRSKHTVFAGFLGVWMFFYIYTPNLQRIPFSVLLPAIALLAYASVRCPSAFLTAFKHKNLFWFSLVWWLAILYSLLVELLAGTESNRSLTDTYPFILARIYIEGVLVAACLISLLRSKTADTLDLLIKSFFWIAAAQFVIVTLMVLFPGLRDYLFLYVLEPIEKLEVGTLRYQIRGYGFASFYLYAFPLFNGLVFFLSAWMSVTRSYWYLIVSVMSLLPIFMNARIGLIFVLIFLLSVVFAVFPRVSIRSIRRLISVTCMGLVLLMGSIVLAVFSGIVPVAMVDWARAGLEEYWQLASKGESSTLNVLLGAHWYVPDGSALLTGEGQYLFRGDHYAGAFSDIGYINFLSYGGVFFSGLVYGAFLLLGITCFRSAVSLFDRCAIAAVLIALFAAQFKGVIFGANPFMKGAVLLLVAYAIKSSPPAFGLTLSPNKLTSPQISTTD